MAKAKVEKAPKKKFYVIDPDDYDKKAAGPYNSEEAAINGAKVLAEELSKNEYSGGIEAQYRFIIV